MCSFCLHHCEIIVTVRAGVKSTNIVCPHNGTYDLCIFAIFSKTGFVDIVPLCCKSSLCKLVRCHCLLKVCDGAGDPCDSVCGGAGCGKCGGSVSCDEGAVTKSMEAIDLCNQSESILIVKKREIETVFNRVSICVLLLLLSNTVCEVPLSKEAGCRCHKKNWRHFVPKKWVTLPSLACQPKSSGSPTRD